MKIDKRAHTAMKKRPKYVQKDRIPIYKCFRYWWSTFSFFMEMPLLSISISMFMSIPRTRTKSKRHTMKATEDASPQDLMASLKTLARLKLDRKKNLQSLVKAKRLPTIP